MPDGGKQTTIEIDLPLALVERIRALAFMPERTVESIVRESLQGYFAARDLVHRV